MDKERSAVINIGGEEYTLVLTTKATKEIAGRYGGLENLGDKLMKSENFEMAIGEIVWLIALLANQSILISTSRTGIIPSLCSPRKKWSFSLFRPILRSINPLLWRLCIRVRSAILKARMTQKTRKSGNRRGTVYPAFLLRHRPASSFVG